MLLRASCSVELHSDASQVESELVIPARANVIPIVESRL